MDGTGGSNPDCLATLMGLEGERKVTAELKMFCRIYFRRHVTLCRGVESLLTQR
jgi:hypothetical protein